MRALGKMMRLVKRFGRGRSGNFGMMFAITAPVLVLGVGYAVNIGQVSLTKSNLLAALDSAVTSTARDLTTGAITEAEAPRIVEAFLIANGLRAYAEDGRLTLDSLVVDRQANTVSAKASVELDVAFALFGAANTQKISAESAALYSDKKIEVAMMLDLTGSMKRSGSDDKLGDLQTAAKNAVTALLGNQNQSQPRIRIALVPYANSVNVGRTIAERSVFVERNASQRRQAPASWEPQAVSTGSSRPDYCATERKGPDDIVFSDVGPEVGMVNRDFLLDEFSARRYDSSIGGWWAASAKCPTAAIVPLTANAKTLNDTIDRFVADGGTGGHIGVQWTWYMLSSQWRNVVGSASAAAPHDPNKVAKYAILMTDGEFNLGFSGATNVNGVYGDAAARRSIPHAKRLCAEMRRAGIEIFTIGFKLTTADARDVMASCATPDTSSTKHYFDTANGEELNAAFQEIARNIERLALTK